VSVAGCNALAGAQNGGGTWPPRAPR
jgi:hypothetical protein